jgi:hypothetical protein
MGKGELKMATATVKLKEIVQPIESVTITINQYELDTLMVILNRIGGCPANSPRKHSANILMALRDATKDIRGRSELYETSVLIEDSGKYAAIYFNDYPEEE